VKAEPDIVKLCKEPGLFELFTDAARIRKIVKPVSRIRMGHAREERRHYSEGADPQPLHSFESQKQAVCVVEADSGEFFQLSVAIESRQRFDSGRTE
jgi:hypothetical protein